MKKDEKMSIEDMTAYMRIVPGRGRLLMQNFRIL